MILAGHLFCVMTPWQFFPDPDRDIDADRHQNVISWSLGPLAAPDHKIRQCIQRSALFQGRAHGVIEATPCEYTCNMRFRVRQLRVAVVVQ